MSDSGSRPARIIAGLILLSTLAAGGYLVLGSGNEQADGSGVDLDESAVDETERDDPALETAPQPPELVSGPPVEIREIEPSEITDHSELRDIRGHYVFVGTERRFVRLDTDSGEVVEFSDEYNLVDHYKDRLILLNHMKGVATVSVDDPGEPKHILLDFDPESSDESDGGSGSFAPFPAIGELYVSEDRWLYLSFYGPQESDGSVRVDLEDKSMTIDDRIWWWQAGHNVVWTPGGGTFRQTVDGYEKVSDGRPMLAGSQTILVDLCDAPEQCRQIWIDRESGEEVDRPPLPGNNDFGQVVGGSDRVARIYQEETEVLWDLDRGLALPENLRGVARQQYFGDFGGDAVTDDDDIFVTVRRGGDLVLYNLDSGDAFAVPVDNRSSSATIVVVPKPNPILSGG